MVSVCSICFYDMPTSPRYHYDKYMLIIAAYVPILLTIPTKSQSV